jgi:hypothetical protein
MLTLVLVDRIGPLAVLKDALNGQGKKRIDPISPHVMLLDLVGNVLTGLETGTLSIRSDLFSSRLGPIRLLDSVMIKRLRADSCAERTGLDEVGADLERTWANLD